MVVIMFVYLNLKYPLLNDKCKFQIFKVRQDFNQLNRHYYLLKKFSAMFIF